MLSHPSRLTRFTYRVLGNSSNEMVSSSVSSRMKIGLTVKQERTWEKHSWGYARPWVRVLNSAICMPVAPPHEGVLDFVCMERRRHLCLCSGTLLLLLFKKTSKSGSSRLKKRNLSFKVVYKVCFAGWTKWKVPQGQFMGLLVHAEQEAMWALLHMWQLSLVNGIAGISQGLCSMVKRLQKEQTYCEIHILYSSTF